MKLITKTCIEKKCRKKFKVRPQHAKRSIRCPECQRELERWNFAEWQRNMRAKKREEKLNNTN